MTRRLAQHARTQGHAALTQRYETKLREVNKRIEIIANVLRNSIQDESSIIEMEA